CWLRYLVNFPFLKGCLLTAPMPVQSSTMRWPKSCLNSKPKSSSDPIKPKASSFYPNVGSSSAQLLGSTGAAVSPRTLKISTAALWVSSASLPYALCSESFAILDKLLGRTLRDYARCVEELHA